MLAHLALKEVQAYEATLGLRVHRDQLVSLDHQDPLDQSVMQEHLEPQDVTALRVSLIESLITEMLSSTVMT